MDDALARANGLPGLMPAQALAQDSATSKNSLPKSASTSHLGGLNQMPPGPMVRLPSYSSHPRVLTARTDEASSQDWGTGHMITVWEHWLHCSP